MIASIFHHLPSFPYPGLKWMLFWIISLPLAIGLCFASFLLMEGLSRLQLGQKFSAKNFPRFGFVRKPPLASTFFHFIEPPLILATTISAFLIFPFVETGGSKNGLDCVFVLLTLLVFPIFISYAAASRSHNAGRIAWFEKKLKTMLLAAVPLLMATVGLSLKYQTTRISGLVAVQGFMPWDWSLFQSVTGFLSGIVFLIGLLAINNFAPFRAVGVFPEESQWLDRNGVDGEILKICARAQQFLWILLFTNLFLGGFNTKLYFVQAPHSWILSVAGIAVLLLKACGLALFMTFVNVRMVSIPYQKWPRMFLLKLTPLALATLAISIAGHLLNRQLNI